MFALWQKGVGGGKLRGGQAKYGTSCHRFYTRMPEQARTNEFEIRIAYKSPRGIHWATYTSGKHMMVINMELFIISVQGVSPRVVIWPRER